MKVSLLYFLVVIALFTFSNQNFGEDKKPLSFGFKGGISIWKLNSIENNPGGPLNGYPKIYNPIGFSAGVFIENNLCGNLSFVNELLFQKSISKIQIYSGDETPVDQMLTMNCLSFPFMLKYQTSWPLLDPYFFGGPTFNYLINAQYHVIGYVYNVEEEYDITSELPNISLSMELGIGKKVNIDKLALLFELRGQYSITRFEDRSVSYQLGNWNNSGLILLLGIQF